MFEECRNEDWQIEWSGVSEIHFDKTALRDVRLPPLLFTVCLYNYIQNNFQLASEIILQKCICYQQPATRSQLEASVLTPQLKSLSTPLSQLFIGRQHKYYHHQNGAGNNKKVIGSGCDCLLTRISNLQSF